MLSPTLLDLLRDYWRAARPKEWLFPGDVPGQPITPSAVEDTCRIVRRQHGIGKPVTPRCATPSRCIYSGAVLTCAPSSCCSAIVA
jgi:integrase